mmetsp:Transcript_37781/g.87756  ORF Transcript_37781/g.87756 Transcript_37781/m.87756 type:complete len:235 (+) Transcript_37781:226-930(+)
MCTCWAELVPASIDPRRQKMARRARWSGSSAHAPIEVFRHQCAEFLLRTTTARSSLLQPNCLGSFGALQDVAHSTPIATGPCISTLAAWIIHNSLEHLPQTLPRLRGQHHHILEEHLIGNLQELLWRVVVEFQHCGKPAAQTRVGVQELLHLLAVTGQDHHEIGSEVLHQLDERIQGFPPEGVLALLTNERIGLIDKEHAAQGALNHGFGLERSLATVARHQGGAVSLHHVTRP